jgi:hypothetical protein
MGRPLLAPEDFARRRRPVPLPLGREVSSLRVGRFLPTHLPVYLVEGRHQLGEQAVIAIALDVLTDGLGADPAVVRAARAVGAGSVGDEPQSEHELVFRHGRPGLGAAQRREAHGRVSAQGGRDDFRPGDLRSDCSLKRTTTALAVGGFTSRESCSLRQEGLRHAVVHDVLV